MLNLRIKWRKVHAIVCPRSLNKLYFSLKTFDMFLLAPQVMCTLPFVCAIVQLEWNSPHDQYRCVELCFFYLSLYALTSRLMHTLFFFFVCADVNSSQKNKMKKKRKKKTAATTTTTTNITNSKKMKFNEQRRDV